MTRIPEIPAPETPTPETPAPDCVTARENMQQIALAGTTDEVRARQVESHVSRCSHCQHELAGDHLAWVDGVLAEHPPSAPTEDEWQRMDQRLAAEPLPVARQPGQPRVGARAWQLARWVGPVAAAALVAVALVIVADPPDAPVAGDDLAMEVEILDADPNARYMIITPEEPGELVLIIVGEL